MIKKKRLRCDLCSILIGDKHAFKQPYYLSVGGIERVLDKWCHDDLKKMTKYRRIIFMNRQEKEQNKWRD